MNKLFKLFYGSSTRSVQTFSIIISFIWLTLISLQLIGVLHVNLPPYEKFDFILLNNFIFFGLLLNSLALFIKTESTLFKIAGLSLSALSQSILAIGYASKYPPFDPMVVVTTVIAIWFFISSYHLSIRGDINGNNQIK